MQEIFVRTQNALYRKEDEILDTLRSLAHTKSQHDSDGDNWDDPNVYETNRQIELGNAELNLVRQQIAESIIINPTDINPSIVSQGTIASIKLMQENSPPDCFDIIVGSPLDSRYVKNDGETPILSTEAPILMSIFGKKVGEILPYQHLGAVGSIEVISINISSLALEV